MKRGFVAAAAVLFASCTPLASSVSTPPSAAPVRRVVPFTRSCDSAVFGRPNMRPAVHVGPLTLIVADQRVAANSFGESHGRYDAIEMFAIVVGTHDVTVTVPLSQRDSVFLLYDPLAAANRWGFRLAEADAQVRFEACPHGHPQYNGGFLLTEPACVKLDVATAEASMLEAAFAVGPASC